MNFFSSFLLASRFVFAHKAYVFLSVIFGLTLFSVNVLLHNSAVLIETHSFKTAFWLLLGAFTSMAWYSLLVLILLSVFGGIVFSFSIYVIKRQLEARVGVGVIGVVTSVVVPACPSCAVGVVGLAGIGGVLGFLPFKGLELGFLGLLLVLGSLVYLSRKIVSTTCSV